VELLLIDLKALNDLQNLIGGRRADLVELIRDFLDDAPGQIAEMAAAAEMQDADTVRRAAHTLKSNGRDLGATLFAQLCGRLESDLVTADLGADLSTRVDAVAKLWPHVLAAFEAEIISDESSS
jgi:HPt (histidine-containing phosphotransfer) domain-containing protein